MSSRSATQTEELAPKPTIVATANMFSGVSAQIPGSSGASSIAVTVAHKSTTVTSAKSAEDPTSVPAISPSTSPMHAKMQSLCDSLIMLAHDSYTTRKPRFINRARYSRLHHKLVSLFDSTSTNITGPSTDGVDFLVGTGADGTFALCLELKTLALLVEMNVRPSSDYQYQPVPWPVARMSVEQQRSFQKVVDLEVDSLIWGKRATNAVVKRSAKQTGRNTKNGIESNAIRVDKRKVEKPGKWGTKGLLGSR